MSLFRKLALQQFGEFKLKSVAHQRNVIAYELSCGFVLFSTVMRITAFVVCVPVNMVCAIMSCWEIDIENFSAVINHVQ